MIEIIRADNIIELERKIDIFSETHTILNIKIHDNFFCCLAVIKYE